jgi:hypothetical protein
MILPLVHQRKPCYDFCFLYTFRFKKHFIHFLLQKNKQSDYFTQTYISSSDGRCVQEAGT